MIVSIRNEEMTCMAYCIKAIILPMFNSPKFIKPAPTQIIAMLVRLKISIITGCITTEMRLTKRFTCINSSLTFENFFCSYFSFVNALITLKPVKFSLVTRFNLSINFYLILNLGRAIANMIPIIPLMRITAISMSQDMEGAF